jgi:hypothetical protein
MAAQTITFLIYAAEGLAAGGAYLLFGLVRRHGRRSPAKDAALDFAFCFLCAAALFLTSLLRGGWRIVWLLSFGAGIWIACSIPSLIKNN